MRIKLHYTSVIRALRLVFNMDRQELMTVALLEARAIGLIETDNGGFVFQFEDQPEADKFVELLKQASRTGNLSVTKNGDFTVLVKLG